MRGTVFPDIRHLKVIERHESHDPSVTLAQVLSEPNSWQAGWLFHNWLDEAWTDYFRQYGLSVKSADNLLTLTTLKLQEELKLREQLREAQAVIRALPEVDAEALKFGVEADAVERWGRLIAGDLERPIGADIANLMYEIGVPTDLIEQTKVRLRDLQAEAVWDERLRQCYAALARQIQAS